MTIWKVRWLKPRTNTCSFLEEIIISSIQVFKDCESDMAVGIGNLGDSSHSTAKSDVIVLQNAGSVIFPLELQSKYSDL